MTAATAETMSQRWRMLFRRPKPASPAAATDDPRSKAAPEVDAPARDEAGVEGSIKAELMAREGRVTAMNARREAAQRSREWIAAS